MRSNVSLAKGELAMTDEEFYKRVREEHAKHYAKERARDARLLAQYQRDCLASWEAKEGGAA